ncbi:MAG: serpin family protein [Deltaproteobacteria bacterium]|nr:serpin family protein [Deltaproteobacteria bacterium]
MRKTLLFLAAALLVVACPADKGPIEKRDKPDASKESTMPPSVDRTDVPATAPGEPAGAPEADILAATGGGNAFAVGLYHQLRKEEGNLFYSPYSLSTALAMTFAGARGETAAQMASAMHFSLDPVRLHPAMAGLSREIMARAEKAGNQLRIANRLWGQQGYAFLPAFLELTRKIYAAELTPLDFAATEPARQTINGWVAGKTADKILDLIPKGVLSPETRLVLTNAIYFKGSWARKFKEEHTRPRPFHLSVSEKTEVPMMAQVDEFRYAQQGDLALLELPYAGDELSMVVLLPDAIDGLGKLEQSLSADGLTAWLKSMREQEVELSLPRFKLSCGFSLPKQLMALGMQLAFGMQADFTGMTAQKPGLYISDVIHKAFVEVNEEGTEAAAATAVVMAEQGLKRDRHPVFRADHPFLFLIRDRKSGQILFLGRVANPLGG